MGRFTHDPRRAADAYYLGKDPFAGVSGSILEFVKTRAGHSIIDFGCGTGGYAAMLQRSGFEVTGVDSNPAHVAAAASLGVPARDVDGALPFADRSVDTLIMIEVLEHLPDDAIESVSRGTATRRAQERPDYRPELRRRFHRAPRRGRHARTLSGDRSRAVLHARRPGDAARPVLSDVRVERGDPGFPHLLLPAALRRPLTGLRRLGLLPPSYYSRLFAEARVDG